MSVSILETLQNAEYNFKRAGSTPLAMSQLHNAIELLSKGYGLYEQVEPLLEKYDQVEDVPEKK